MGTVRNARTTLTTLGIVLAIVGMLGYATFALRGYIFGPSVQILFPTNGADVPAGLIVIQGDTARVKTLSINGAPVSIQQDGTFSFPLVVFPPYTILDVLGTDTFGKQQKITLQLSVK